MLFIFDFIKSLSESSLLPSTESLANEIANLVGPGELRLEV